jgi:hypothetical protein
MLSCQSLKYLANAAQNEKTPTPKAVAIAAIALTLPNAAPISIFLPLSSDNLHSPYSQIRQKLLASY